MSASALTRSILTGSRRECPAASAAGDDPPPQRCAPPRGPEAEPGSVPALPRIAAPRPRKGALVAATSSLIAALVSLGGSGCAATGGSPSGTTDATERRASVLLLDADLETGDLSQFDGVEAASHELRVVPEPVRGGRLAARALVDEGEQDVGGSGYRAEVTKDGAGGANQERERWFGLSTYLPDGWQIVEAPGSDVLFQIHERPDPFETWRSPPLALRVVGTKMRWEVKWDPRPCSVPESETGGPVRVATSPVAPGRWVDWVVHVRWSYGPDGLVEVWRDGESIGTYRGPTAYNDRRPMYLKVGLYRSGGRWPDGLPQRVSYFDEVRMAGPDGRYADVAPGSG